MRSQKLKVKSRKSKGSFHLTFELFVFFIFFSLLPSALIAQNVIASASLDTNAILIGQQAKLKLKIEYKTGQGDLKIDFPKIADTLIKEIEVVGKSKVEKYIPDSSDMSLLAQELTLTITSFDSGYYAIPPFVFIINGDSGKGFQTEPLLFSVNTVAVDTTQNIKDIKPPIEVPFSWKEYLPYVYWALGSLAVIGAIILLVIYLVKNKKPVPVPEIIAPKIPPHVTAIERLEKLRDEKLWLQGKLKQYYSELSDIIRQYIEHRFYIHAMEKVSDEIMYSFRTADASEEMKMKLRQVLLLSDLVKFAKEQPLPNENDLSWNNAYEFVSGTKQEEKTETGQQTEPAAESTQ